MVRAKRAERRDNQYTSLRLETVEGVALVWMNRPEARNALDETMIAELTGAFQRLDAAPEVRAVVLAGIGPAFCAGVDLNRMKRMAGFSLKQNAEDAMELARMLAALASMKKPTVARVHGAAFAGGTGLVAACDIAVAAHEAEFCLSEVKLGLVPATVSPYVIAAMGERMAHRYFLSAERFSASEAYRIGLAQEIAPIEELDATVNQILGHLVQGAPEAHAATKELMRAVARKPLTQALIADTAKRTATARASKAGREGVRAFLERRQPNWVPEQG